MVHMLLSNVVRVVRKVVVGLVAVVLVAAAAIYLLSERRLSRTYAIAETVAESSSDDATLARGRHVATAIAKCVDCHGDDFGGKVVVDAGPVGRFVGANLTTGRGGIGSLDATTLARAVRHGVGRGGRALKFMPSHDYQAMSDADIAALAAYLRTRPSVDRDLGRSTVGPVGRALFVTGKMPLVAAEMIDHAPQVRGTPIAAVSVEYGRYLAKVSGCHGCHGPQLQGGRIPGTPPEIKPAADISAAALADWTQDDFTRALREGIRKNGTPIDPFMPWAMTKLMTDDEIAALWLYLRQVDGPQMAAR